MSELERLRREIEWLRRQRAIETNLPALFRQFCQVFGDDAKLVLYPSGGGAIVRNCDGMGLVGWNSLEEAEAAIAPVGK